MPDQHTHRTPLAVTERRYEIIKNPLTLLLALPAHAQAALKKTLEAKPEEMPTRVLLTVEEIQFEKKASGIVEVYLNLHKEAPDKSTDKAHAVGTFATFSGHAHPPEKGGLTPPAYPKEAAEHAEVPRFSRVFDVTEALRRLRAAGHWKDNELRVTLVRRPLDKKEKTLEGKVTFGRITLDLDTGN